MTSSPPESAAHRGIKSFVLRAGRMGTGQVRALRELAPRYVLPFTPTPLDAAQVFGRQAPLVVEIGFGMGQATVAIAAERADNDFLGIEVHEPGVGALLRRWLAQGRRLLWFNRTMAGVLAATALWMLRA